ncbi:hypothetical protein M9H77_33999 [Catharanthus roseus]|uniref:Uncharacterized protein n=1 Tax=Catharanthus roseus TaxID=4058 RepID=A0ACB9ZKS6_CATRO|nr:hypothetical protein M9H77_33999 [Catharanthus roseus]
MKETLPTQHCSVKKKKREIHRSVYINIMASRLTQFRDKAAEASKCAARYGCEYYKKLVERNERYVQEPPTIEKCQLLAKQLLYTRLASIPHRREAFWKEIEGVKKHLKEERPEMKLEDAGIAALFGFECLAWFCAGEIIGRGFTILGYSV